MAVWHNYLVTISPITFDGAWITSYPYDLPIATYRGDNLTLKEALSLMQKKSNLHLDRSHRARVQISGNYPRKPAGYDKATRYLNVQAKHAAPAIQTAPTAAQDQLEAF